MKLNPTQSPARARFAVGSFFFLHGFCFSSWGARIPDLQHHLSLSEAELGTLLFTLPVGSILCLGFASKVISWMGTRRVLQISMILYAATLLLLGFAESATQLGGALLLFGIMSNLVNVSANTQAIGIERIYKKQIMASFHGLWSLAGFTGAAIGALMMSQQISPRLHFIFSSIVIVIGAALHSQSLLLDSARITQPKKQPWVLPDSSLLLLGVITFCSMVCEGTMFDWSGVYFEKIVQAKEGWIGAGYAAFMSTMAGTRFLADDLKIRFGFTRVLQACGVLIATGLSLSILFPTLIPALIGFFLVGAGTSAVVPFAFSEAGNSSSRSASSAISTISAIGFLGFLIGPPMIGWIAGATSLRVSFTVIVFFGAAIAALVGIRKDPYPSAPS